MVLNSGKRGWSFKIQLPFFFNLAEKKFVHSQSVAKMALTAYETDYCCSNPTILELKQRGHQQSPERLHFLIEVNSCFHICTKTLLHLNKFQGPTVGILTKNFSEKSNVPHTVCPASFPGPLGLNIDKCIIKTLTLQNKVTTTYQKPKDNDLLFC